MVQLTKVGVYGQTVREGMYGACADLSWWPHQTILRLLSHESKRRNVLFRPSSAGARTKGETWLQGLVQAHDNGHIGDETPPYQCGYRIGDNCQVSSLYP